MLYPCSSCFAHNWDGTHWVDIWQDTGSSKVQPSHDKYNKLLKAQCGPWYIMVQLMCNHVKCNDITDCNICNLFVWLKCLVLTSKTTVHIYLMIIHALSCFIGPGGPITNLVTILHNTWQLTKGRQLEIPIKKLTPSLYFDTLLT